MSRVDHDRIYSTPGLPRFEIHELDDRLLAGRNPLSAIDAQRLVDAGVEALPGDLLGDVELRRLIVTLADDLVDVQSCDEESMSDRWWERYPGY